MQHSGSSSTCTPSDVNSVSLLLSNERLEASGPLPRNQTVSPNFMRLCPGNGRKRKAPSPDSPDVIQLSASSSDAGKASPSEGSGSDMSFGSDAQNGAASPQQNLPRGPGSPQTIVFSAGAGPRKQRAGHPKGVIVVEEGALPERNSEVKRLLRGSRWVHQQPHHGHMQLAHGQARWQGASTCCTLQAAVAFEPTGWQSGEHLLQLGSPALTLSPGCSCRRPRTDGEAMAGCGNRSRRVSSVAGA